VFAPILQNALSTVDWKEIGQSVHPALYSIIIDVADRLNAAVIIKPAFYPCCHDCAMLEDGLRVGSWKKRSAWSTGQYSNDWSLSKIATCYLLILDICEDISSK
jgi:hypothetical protein